MDPVEAALETARIQVRAMEPDRIKAGILAREAVAAFVSSLHEYNRDHAPDARLDLHDVAAALFLT